MSTHGSVGDVTAVAFYLLLQKKHAAGAIFGGHTIDDAWESFCALAFPGVSPERVEAELMRDLDHDE